MPEDEKPTPDTEPTVPVDAVPGNPPEAAPGAPGVPEAPTEAPTEVAAPEAPTAVATDAVPREAPAATEPPHAKDSKAGPRWAVALVLVLVLGVGGGFLIGRATAPDSGPQSLSDAVSQTAKGDLPVGQLDLQELLQSIGKQKGGALGQILGGGGSSGSNSVGGILGGLIDGLRNKVGGSSSGSDSSSATAYLGVRAQAAPAGTNGVVVAEVAAGSPAADAGLQAGDVITKVDDTAVAQPSALAAAVQDHAPGDAVTITYTRNGASATAKVRLASASSATTPTTTPATTPATTQAPANA